MNAVRVVKRATMPAIHSVNIDGATHHLGVLKDFHWCEGFAEFVPEGAPLSMSWVHLGAGEVLSPHVHPTASMIVICEGRVSSLGEVEQELQAGDALLVPPGRLHGFKGLGPDGFWGLSIQFESQSLYRDPSAPRVTFAESGSAGGDLLSTLLERNQAHLRKFADNPLFRMARSSTGCFADDPAASFSIFLDYFQVWSNAFQRTLLSRAALCEDPRFRALADEHLSQEFGHNTALAGGRGRGPAREAWDPILSACCEWFEMKMLTLDNPERTVLIHLVIEASADVFYASFDSLARRAGEGARHFDLHAHGVDHGHVEMGIELLRDLPPGYLDRLCDIQSRGWDMLNTMFQRIAELVDRAAAEAPRRREGSPRGGPEVTLDGQACA